MYIYKKLYTFVFILNYNYTKGRNTTYIQQYTKQKLSYTKRVKEYERIMNDEV